MNKLYLDTKQKAVVKICMTAEIARREVEGARVFRSIVRTCEPQLVDAKTLIMNVALGEVSTSVSSRYINTKALELIKKEMYNPASEKMRQCEYSIVHSIRTLMTRYAYSKDIQMFLSQLLTDIEQRAFYPIHGDLQKQNMFIDSSGVLTLIDFEHFCYAPIEFELINGMFHSDGNCLDIQYLLQELRKECDISEELIRKALVMYALKRV